MIGFGDWQSVGASNVLTPKTRASDGNEIILMPHTATGPHGPANFATIGAPYHGGVLAWDPR